MPSLLPSQEQGIRAAFNYMETNRGKHPLLVYPTGAGKSHVIAGICAEVHERWPREKVLVLSHVAQILRQDYDTIIKYIPKECVGVYSAGLGRREVKKITVAGIQSVYNRQKLFADYRLIIVDEAHLIPPSGEGRYRSFFEALPQYTKVGLTATKYRLGHGLLTDGIFDKIVFEKKIPELIDEGRLCKLTSKETKIKMDTKEVGLLASDFNKKQLASKFDVKAITENIVCELIKYKDIRKHWLVFAIDIAHAEHITQSLIEHEIAAACIHSQQKGVDASEIIDFFKEGGFQALVSVAKLTVGFDAPNVDLVALLRPTISPVLHIQMIGRGLRTCKGKKDCLILDFARNLERLGPIDNVTIPRKAVKYKAGAAKTKTCPECSEIVALSAKRCTYCNFTFSTQVKLEETASELAVIGRQSNIKEYIVERVAYKKHTSKNSGNISVQVTYFCGMLGFNEWISFSTHPRAKLETKKWWNRRGVTRIPLNIAEALKICERLKTPKAIFVELSGKYPCIKAHNFGE
jgi:DNA repair protein RadD